jgi:hypothetical protein
VGDELMTTGSGIGGGIWGWQSRLVSGDDWVGSGDPGGATDDLVLLGNLKYNGRTRQCMFRLCVVICEVDTRILLYWLS